MTDYERLTDAELLRASRRDPHAFAEISRRHSLALVNYLSALLRDDTLARELLAETLSEAWFSRKRFRDQGDGSAKPWLYGIARNLARRALRTRQIESRARARLGLETSSDDAHAAVLERLSARQELGSSAELLETLPPDQRRALELRVVDELEYREIADRLEISEEGARTRVFRALRTLRADLERSS